MQTDAVVEIWKIQSAAAALRDTTAFLSEFPVLDEKILVVKKSVNELIAGQDRTLSDIFDFTGKSYRTEL